MEKIKVSASREYEVIIHSGILSDAGKYIESALSGRPKLAIITDDRVDSLHGEALMTALSGFECVKFVFKNGEASKNISVYGEILEFLAENNITSGWLDGVGTWADPDELEDVAVDVFDAIVKKAAFHFFNWIDLQDAGYSWVEEQLLYDDSFAADYDFDEEGNLDR